MRIVNGDNHIQKSLLGLEESWMSFVVKNLKQVSERLRISGLHLPLVHNCWSQYAFEPFSVYKFYSLAMRKQPLQTEKLSAFFTPKITKCLAAYSGFRTIAFSLLKTVEIFVASIMWVIMHDVDLLKYYDLRFEFWRLELRPFQCGFVIFETYRDCNRSVSAASHLSTQTSKKKIWYESWISCF